MKLWIDDVRPMPEGFDFWAKTTKEAIYYLDHYKISFISFDHDLGKEETGYAIALEIESRAALQKVVYKQRSNPIQWEIHSAGIETYLLQLMSKIKEKETDLE